MDEAVLRVPDRMTACLSAYLPKCTSIRPFNRYWLGSASAALYRCSALQYFSPSTDHLTPNLRSVVHNENLSATLNRLPLAIYRVLTKQVQTTQRT
jgi:hypothetical protein